MRDGFYRFKYQTQERGYYGINTYKFKDGQEVSYSNNVGVFVHETPRVWAQYALDKLRIKK